MRRFLYLISPKKINEKFYKNLDEVLSFKNVEYFQLRLKKQSIIKITNIAKKIKKITKKYNVKLIINDNPKIAKKVNADGCHVGQMDSSIFNAKKILKNKIIGVTCHNSKKLINKALDNKASYVALGSFYKSKLKPNAKKANTKILKWVKKNTKKPIVVIGGITDKNYKNLIVKGANYIAISSFIWDNPFLKPEIAIRKFK